MDTSSNPDDVPTDHHEEDASFMEYLTDMAPGDLDTGDEPTVLSSPTLSADIGNHLSFRLRSSAFTVHRICIQSL